MSARRAGWLHANAFSPDASVTATTDLSSVVNNIVIILLIFYFCYFKIKPPLPEKKMASTIYIVITYHYIVMTCALRGGSTIRCTN